MQAAAQRALANQPRVSAFYKRPLLELGRRLARSQLAAG